MTRITRFEDLIAWQRARYLAAQVTKAVNRTRFSSWFKLKNQIHAAAFSIMSNIAEGFERGTPAEFRHYLSIAKGSAGEVRSLLYHAHDAGLLEANEFNELLKLAEESGRIIGGLRRAVSRQVETRGRTPRGLETKQRKMTPE